MRQTYSKDIEDKVIELYACGYSFQEIHDQIHVSIGYISSVKEKYEEKLGKGELDAVHEFFKIVRKINISPQQLLVGAKTFSLLQENKLNSEELKPFLKKVSKIIPEKDFDLPTIIEIYEKVLVLESKLKVSLDHLPAECESLANKAASLRKEVSELSHAKEKADTELKNALNNVKQTSENIRQFVTIKTELEKNDIDFSNLQKLCTILKRSEENNFDFLKIKKHLEKETDYESRIAQLDDGIRTLEAREANLQAKNEEISGKITQNKDKLQQAEHLKKLKIPTPDFIQFSKKIVEISKMHGISPKNAFSIFVKSLTNYDALKGFQKELERIKNEIEKQSSNLEALTLKRENFEIKHKENLEVIQIIKKLKRQKVVPEQIIFWNNIFESSRLDPKVFSKEIEKIGNLHKIIIHLDQRIGSTNNEITKLESHKKWLESNIDELESKLKNMDKIAQNSLDSFLDDARKKISEANLHSVNTINDTNRRTIDVLEQRISEFEKWVDKSLEESKKLGKLEWVLEFYDFVLGENFVPSRDLPIVITILERLLVNLKKQNLGSTFVVSHIKQVKDDLEEILVSNA